MSSATPQVPALTCAGCGTPLAIPEMFNGPEPIACPKCGTLLRTLIFPAFFREGKVEPKPETLLIEGESSCFYHPQKRAVVPCGHCGRFLCALCDIDFNGEHVCPSCLERGRNQRTIATLEHRRIRYDTLALMVALLPLLFCPLTLFSAPATLYLVVRFWNAPGSIVGSSKVRFVLAALAALAEIAGWTLWLYYLFAR